jgi:hypothetical protein
MSPGFNRFVVAGLAASAALLLANAATAAAPQILTNLHDGAALSAKTGKPLFVLAGQDWCPHTVKVRDVYVATDPAVQAALAGYVVVELTGAPGAHLVGELGTGGYPTLLVYSKTGRELWRVDGEPPHDALVEGLTAADKANTNDHVAVPTVAGLQSSAGASAPTVSAPGEDAPAPSAEAERAAEQGTTKLVAADKGAVTLTLDDGALNLGPTDLAPQSMTTASGEQLWFATGADHVIKVVSSQGYADEIGYQPTGAPAAGKINLVATRDATAQELTTAGFAQAKRQAVQAKSVGFSFDANGNLIGIKQTGSGGRDFALTNDAAGRIAQMVESGNPTSIRFSYTPAGKIAQISEFQDGGKPIGSIQVGYDDQGNIAKVQSVAPAGGPSDNGRQLSNTASGMFSDLSTAVNQVGSAELRTMHIYY